MGPNESGSGIDLSGFPCTRCGETIAVEAVESHNLQRHMTPPNHDRRTIPPRDTGMDVMSG